MQVLLFSLFVCVRHRRRIVRYRSHLFTSDTHRCHLLPCLSRSFFVVSCVVRVIFGSSVSFCLFFGRGGALSTATPPCVPTPRTTSH